MNRLGLGIVPVAGVSKRMSSGSGVPCPRCRNARSIVTDSRQREGGMRRRRHCTSCAHRWTTYETADIPDPDSAPAHQLIAVRAGLEIALRLINHLLGEQPNDLPARIFGGLAAGPSIPSAPAERPAGDGTTPRSATPQPSDGETDGSA